MRAATGDDVPAVVEVLGRAFADYPWTRHTVAADGHPARVRSLHELFLTRIGLPHGTVHVTGDRSAAAIWTTPRTQAVEVFAALAPEFAALAGDRRLAQDRAEEALAPYRPAEPCWFLSVVGVDPGSQRRGLGSAVVEPGLDAAEQEGVPAFLETSTAGGVRFYQRLGFEVTAEVEIPDGGPRTWSMVRWPW